MPLYSLKLTTKGTEPERVQQAALTRLAGVGDAFGRSWLRPFIQKHYARAVDDVSLHACDVQHLLDLGNSDHIVVGRTSNLHHMVVLMLREAERANPATLRALQTEEIAFTFVRVHAVNLTRREETRRQQWLQPPRLHCWIVAVSFSNPYRTSHRFDSSSLGRTRRSLQLHRLDRQLFFLRQNLWYDMICSNQQSARFQNESYTGLNKGTRFLFQLFASLHW